MRPDSGPSADAATAAGGSVAAGDVCYGLRAEAAFELQLGRPGIGAPLRVEVGDVPVPDDTPLFEWSEHGLPFARLWPGHAPVLWLDGIGAFLVEPSVPAITVPPSSEVLRREASLWSFPALLCLLARGDLGIHAAAIEIDGRAVVLAAPGMHGKTTLAGAFVRAGHRLLSEDLTCIDVRSGEPTVLPGPALLKMRGDTVERLGFPPASVLAQIGRRTYVTQLERGTAAPVPLAGVVLLREHDGSAPRMSRVEAQRTLPELWTLSFKLPEDADRARCFRQIASVAAAVPVWDLHRPLSYDLLPDVIDLIRRHASP